ncbi:hypothetical protein BV898_18936 [Hypsibius exemplaris]|uniref:Uncharacterized protein n=1 Tax=Hypsibius exemplaris TaxID=2072580 RepID=A0A9X6NPW6_HYPEX|nr:hypothetical protein BV898_18936 [Hypsibius exemplaris]
MDSDKENSLEFANEDSTTLFGDSLELEYTIEQEQTPPLDLTEDPLTEAEIRLSEEFPALSEPLARLKVLTGLSTVEDTFLGAVITGISKQTNDYRDIQAQAEESVARSGHIVEYFIDVVADLEAQMQPILKLFGVDLPTEEWHVEAIRAVIREKVQVQTDSLRRN